MTNTEALPTSYGMFSDRANKMVRNALKRVLETKKSHVDRAYLVSRIRREMGDIASANPEVYDTDVREQILYALEPFIPMVKEISTSEIT